MWTPEQWIHSESDLLAAIPNYQRKRIEVLLKSEESPKAAARAWITFDGHIAPFGGSQPGNFEKFWVNLLSELRGLLCDENKYQAERNEILSKVGAGNATFSGAVAYVLAPHLSMAAVVLTPLVTIVLILVIRAGKKTVCEALASITSD